MRNRALRFLSYALVGVAVALAVAAVEWVAIELLLHELTDSSTPLWVVAGAPFVGLLAANVILRYLAGGASTATSEEYIRAYHSRRATLRLRDLPARLAAGVATVGMGGALGLEGPSIHAGATIGASFQHRLRRFFTGKDAKMLLVAGAAAGVAAVFKTPATGVLFALESPYQGDVARRALLPSLVASATSYLTFAGIFGTAPIFNIRSVGDVDDFGGPELLGAVAIGVLAGLGARLFSRGVAFSKSTAATRPWWHLVLVGGAVLAGLAVLVHEVADEYLTLGPGTEVFAWSIRDQGVFAVTVVLAARLVASFTTIAANGVGGVFIPLAVTGILLGELVGLAEAEVFNEIPSGRFFSGIGLAAFLAAGYRTPLAAVMFVAESTGRSDFVVPALIAVAVSQVFVGRSSVSAYQRDTRVGHLERRFTMAITSAMSTDVQAVDADSTLSEFVWNHAVPRRELTAVAVSDGRYVGMCTVHDAAEVERDQWTETPVRTIVQTGVPAARLSWTLREATAVMEEHELEHLAVVDGAQRLIGVVHADEILKIDELLDETADER